MELRYKFSLVKIYKCEWTRDWDTKAAARHGKKEHIQVFLLIKFKIIMLSHKLRTEDHIQGRIYKGLHSHRREEHCLEYLKQNVSLCIRFFFSVPPFIYAKTLKFLLKDHLKLE